MAKSVDSITRALKLKAESRNNALTFRVGVKKHTLPFEVRALVSGDYLFVHVPPAAGLMKITAAGLVPVSTEAEATAAAASFRKPRKRGGKRTRTSRTSSAEVPEAVMEAMKMIPKGFKLVAGADGQPRLVKTRARKAAGTTSKAAVAAPKVAAAAKPAAKKAAPARKAAAPAKKATRATAKKRGR
ncbi:MAG TPA: hypothetical protein PLO61_02740 [Fimbriimonadaceae bacterium]|nr:hypothetical protein [Fimbriimonadaceae bacterium]HRJ32025.1 hypothetical protein [Fimbriimonadaceae bacterium]